MKRNLRQVALSFGILSLALCTGGETNPTPTPDVEAVQALSGALAPPAADKIENTDMPVAIPDAFADTVSAPNPTNVVVAQTLPKDLNLSPVLAEVVKLIQGGVGQEVVLAYVTNSSGMFNIGSKEILYLHDLGTPAAVLTVLIQRDSSPEAEIRRRAGVALPLPPEMVLHSPATNVYPATATVANPPEPTPIAPPEDVQTVVTPPAVPVDPVEEPVSVEYFESELSPYGSWVYVNGYGNCWRPTVSVWNSSWRPYVDGGRWLWTDSGWYWYSDYSWGWAPFHYGRWFCPPGLGWVWYPDTCWGPSWVSWRYSAGYCGWAPLPPAAHWVYGWGFHYDSYYVGIGCEFGLGYSSYCFVPYDRFCDRNVGLHVTHGNHSRHAYENSKVVNNYGIRNRNVINNGPGVDNVAAVTRGNVKRVTLRDTTDVRDLSGRREQLAVDGQSLVVSRPGAAILREGASPAGARPRANGNGIVSSSSTVSRPAVPSHNVQQSTVTSRPQDVSRRVDSSSTFAGRESANISEPARPSAGSQAARPFAPDRPTTRAPIIIRGNSSANQNSIVSSPNGSGNSPASGPVSRPQSSARVSDEMRTSAPFQQREAVRVNPIQTGSPVVSRPSNPAPSRPSYSAPGPAHNAPSVGGGSQSAPSRPGAQSSVPAQVSRGGGGGGSGGGSSANVSRGGGGGGGGGGGSSANVSRGGGGGGGGGGSVSRGGGTSGGSSGNSGGGGGGGRGGR